MFHRSADYGKTFTNITDIVSTGSHVLYQSIHVAPNDNKIVGAQAIRHTPYLSSISLVGVQRCLSCTDIHHEG